MWMCTPPSSTIRRASAAYSSGVYGIAGHWSRLASAPEMAQVMTTGSSRLKALRSLRRRWKVGRATSYSDGARSRAQPRAGSRALSSARLRGAAAGPLRRDPDLHAPGPDDGRDRDRPHARRRGPEERPEAQDAVVAQRQRERVGDRAGARRDQVVALLA